MTCRRVWIVFLTAMLILGCAKVTVRKVPSKTQYQTWTDKEQRKVDKMDGIRFYLPRPFIHVHESFVVGAETYILTAVISADGRHIILSKPKQDSPLHKIIQSDAAKVVLPSALTRGKAGPGPQAQLEEVTPSEVTTGAEPTEEAKQPSGSGTSEVKAKTGINKTKVTNDNSAIAITPLRKYFDIVFLPDFDEQYVIRSWSRLGNANTEINLGQGWSLQGMFSESDNSELNRRIFDMVDAAAEAAKTAGLTALGLPPPATGAISLAEVIPGAGPQAKGPGEIEVTGQPATVKITVAKYATPGLYPLIKRRELIEKQMNQSTFASELKTHAPFPVEPFGYISFNTMDYLVIELVEAGAQPQSIVRTLPNRTTGAAGGQTEDPCMDSLLKITTKEALDLKLNPNRDSDKAWVVSAIDPTNKECSGYTVRMRWMKAGEKPDNSQETAKQTVLENWKSLTELSTDIVKFDFKNEAEGQ